MKESYEPILAEIILFESIDVLTESGDTPLPETDDDG